MENELNTCHPPPLKKIKKNGMGVICNKPINLDTFREQNTLKVRNKNCDWGEERIEKTW